ncbi:MAG: hypothetical protein R3C99_20645 [Pirellulaceae bacterium]
MTKAIDKILEHRLACHWRFASALGAVCWGFDGARLLAKQLGEADLAASSLLFPYGLIWPEGSFRKHNDFRQLHIRGTLGDSTCK